MGTVSPDSLESGQASLCNSNAIEKSKDISGLGDKFNGKLVPEPSDSPYDPLNWSWSKKHTILLVLSATAFLPDYGAASGASTQLPQAE